MTDATILIIEGRHTEIPSFATELQKKGFNVETAKSGSDAISHLNKASPDLVVVNAASLRSSGVRICQSLRDKNDKLPIILILDKDNTAAKDTAAKDTATNAVSEQEQQLLFHAKVGLL